MAWTCPPSETSVLAQFSQLDDLREFFVFDDLDLDNTFLVDPTSASVVVSGNHLNTSFGKMGAMHNITGAAATVSPMMQKHICQQQLQREVTACSPTSHPFAMEAMYQNTKELEYQPMPQFAFPAQSGCPAAAKASLTPTSLEIHDETNRLTQVSPPLELEPRTAFKKQFQLHSEDEAFTPDTLFANAPIQLPALDYTVDPSACFSHVTSPGFHIQSPLRGQEAYLPSVAATLATPVLSLHSDTDAAAKDSLSPDFKIPAVKPKLKCGSTPCATDGLARFQHTLAHKVVWRESASLLSGLENYQKYKQPAHGLSSRSDLTGMIPPIIYWNDDNSASGSICAEFLGEAVMPPMPNPRAAMHPLALATRSGMSEDCATLYCTNTVKGTAERSKVVTSKSFLSIRSTTTVGDEGSCVDNQLSIMAAKDDRSTLGTALLRSKLVVNGSDSADVTLTRPITTTSTPSGLSTAAICKTIQPGPLSTSTSSMIAALVLPTSASTRGALPCTSGSANSFTSAKTSGSSHDSKKHISSGSKIVGSSSTSSRGLWVMMSPAIPSKIRPNTKHLLPGGCTLHSSTHAQLLAFNSNRQISLEGNILPGISYPDRLPTGLTSKLVSHNVAEQGRRNRMNQALKEMQALLPPRSIVATKEWSSARKGDGDGGKKVAIADAEGANSIAAMYAKSNMSKLATFESANEYIRHLQKENAQVSALRTQLEDVKMQLARMLVVASPCVPETITEEREATDGSEPQRKRKLADTMT